MENLWFCLPACLKILPLVAVILGNHAAGQGGSSSIVFDSSLGKPSAPLIGGTIASSQGTQVGGNLFHSFSQFNVAKGDTATFQVPADVGNILARVTGGSPSQIDGTVATDAPVNLYLMNPNGIVFGNGASVDVAGSFTATTADYISFKDTNGMESRFWASTDGATTLVSDPPLKFGFLESGASGEIKISLSDGSGEITNDGASFLKKGSFTATARAILVQDSRVFHEKGNLSFGTINTGEIGIDGNRLTTTGVMPRGEITFTNSSFQSFSSRNFQAWAGGNLTIDGTTIVLVDRVAGGLQGKIDLSSGSAMTLRTAASIRNTSFSTGEAEGIVLDVGTNLMITENSGIVSSARGTGSGPDVSVKVVGNLILDDFGEITSVSEAAGSGGAIQIEAGGNIKISSSGTIICGAKGKGNGGIINIRSSGHFEIFSFGLIQSGATGEGNGGAIHITSSGNLGVSGFGLIQSGATGEGNGGAIQIQAGGLRIKGESERRPNGRTTGIESLTAARGAGGSISVNVDGDILLQDTGGIYASANARGQSGSIHLISDSLKIIGARNYSASEESTRPDNFFITGISIKNARNELTGNLGSIKVEVQNLISLERGGLIDATSFSLNPAAAAGSVSVSAGEIRADRMGSDYFTGIGSGTVTDESSGDTGSGRGGVVWVEAPLIGLFGGAQIAASSRSGGDAGRVTVMTHQFVASGRGPETDFLFTGESGIVAATRGQSTGGAGDVTVLGTVSSGIGSRPSLILSNGAEISARAEGKGGGGSVVIDYASGSVSLDSGAAISARSGVLGGDAGSVTITAADIQVSNGASISSTNGAGAAIGGNAGSVTLNPGSLRVNGGRLEVSATGGNAGSVTIFGGELLDLINAEVVAEAFLDGGNISMEGARSLLLDQSRISANAERGNGGNILLNADVILNNGSQITASSRFGVDGVVRIDPQAALSGAEEQADPDPLDVTDSLQPECTNRLATAAGSFIRAGKGGTPRLPGGYLPSLRLHRAP